MRLRGLFVCTIALALAGIDLALKAELETPAWAFHQRSHTWVALCLGLLAAAAAFAGLPSRAVACSAGTFAGGVLGNLLSGVWNGLLVPNPFTLPGIAFNAADVFVLAGLVGLTLSLAAVSIHYRSHLLPPRRWEQALLRRLGS